jgi:DNA-binding MarR family transcriptional regulator
MSRLLLTMPEASYKMFSATKGFLHKVKFRKGLATEAGMDSKTAMEYAERFNKLIPEFVRAAKNQEVKRLSRYSLTLPQYFAMSALEDNGTCMMSGMGEELGLTLGTVTGIVDRLVREGLVERCADDNDRRIVLARLTQKGLKLIQRIHQDRVETISESLRKMDKEEIVAFTELLVKVGTRIARDDI